MAQTALGAALQDAGLDPCIVQAEATVALWINNGRSEGEMHRLVSALYAKSRTATVRLSQDQSNSAAPRPELPSEASSIVPQGRVPPASARQPESGTAIHSLPQGHLEVADPRPELPERAKVPVPQGQLPAASPRQPQSDGDHNSTASQATAAVSLSPLRVVHREPSALARKVMTHVAKTLATVTINDYMVLGKDGKPRPMKRGELRSQAKKHRKKAMLYEVTAEHLDRHYPNGDMAADVVSLIDLPTYERLAQDVVYE